MDNLKYTAIKGIKWTSLSSVILAVVKLFQVSILTRFLVPDDFGIVAIALLFISFGDIFIDMGITSAVLHYNNISIKQYSSLFWSNTVLSFLIALLVFLCANVIAIYYDSFLLIPVVRLLSINLFITSVSRLHKTFLQKNMRFKSIALIEIVSALLMLIMAIGFAYFNYGVYSLIYSTLISSLITSIFSILAAFQLNHYIRFYFSFRGIRDFLKIGYYQLMASLVEFFSREIDVIFISSSFSLELLGYYTICKQLAQKIFTIINPIIVKIAIPLLATIQNDLERLKSLFLRMISLTAIINFPIYFIVALIARYALSFLYGDTYAQYDYLLIIFSINYSILSIGSLTGTLTVALGKTSVGFIWSIYKVVSMFVVCFLLHSVRFECFIFCITIGITVINYYPAFLLTVKRFLPINFKEYIGTVSFPFIISLFLFIPLYLFSFFVIPIVGTFVLPVLFMLCYLMFNKIFNKRMFGYVLQQFKK